MPPLHEASRRHPRAATCGFVARKGTLAESTITYLAPHNARPHHNLRHGKWLHPLEVFFNITNRSVVNGIHGVVRWRACDLIMRLYEEFGLSVSNDTIYRALKKLGFSH